MSKDLISSFILKPSVSGSSLRWFQRLVKSDLWRFSLVASSPVFLHHPRSTDGVIISAEHSFPGASVKPLKLAQWPGEHVSTNQSTDLQRPWPAQEHPSPKTMGQIELISTHQAQFLWWYLACKVLFPEACRFLPWWDSSFSWDSGGELEGLICRWSLWVYLSLGENRLDILRIKFCLSCVISATEVGWESNILSSGHPG